MDILAEPGLGDALLLLLAEVENGDRNGIIGRWAGNKIALVGDYAEREDLPPEFNADLIWDLLDGEGGRLRAIEHHRQRGEIDVAERLQVAHPYRNITRKMATVLANGTRIQHVLQGWAIANPSKAEVVVPSRLVDGCRDKRAKSLLPGAALVVLAAAQRDVRGAGDLDVETNQHGPEQQIFWYADHPAPMPEEYSALARRTIGRWAGHSILVTRHWGEYQDITTDVREILQHELYWLW